MEVPKFKQTPTEREEIEKNYEPDPAVLEMLIAKIKSRTTMVDDITIADAATRLMRAAEIADDPYTLTSLENEATGPLEVEIDRAVKAAEMQRGSPDLDVVAGKVVSPSDQREAA